jgi:deoxyribonuclease V
MKPVVDHPWALSSDEAIQLQQTLAAKVIQQDQFGPVRLVAGTDVAYAKDSEVLSAAVVLIDASTLAVVETVVARDVARFPYVPGLFSFRELPPLLQAMAKLQHTPDLVICDGQGIAHPRRFGLASHFGVLFDVPSIGCGKTLLTGKHAPLANDRGARSELIDNDATVGAALRTQDGVNPLYISIGHRITLETACNWILRLAPHYRLPEPIRLADQAAGRR